LPTILETLFSLSLPPHLEEEKEEEEEEIKQCHHRTFTFIFRKRLRLRGMVDGVICDIAG